MKLSQNISPLARAGLALALAMPAGVAIAEEEQASERQPPPKRWQVTVGAGALSRPEYPGSESAEVDLLPVVNVRYGRFFLGGVPGGGAGGGGLGAFLYEDSAWSIGSILSGDLDSPRDESDDARLRGLGDIDQTVRAGVFASYRLLSWLSLNASALADVGGNDQGTLASFDVEASYRLTPRLGFSAGPGILWGNDDYAQTFFGVSADQAARSSFTRYEAGSGANLVRFSLGAQYALTRQWSLGSRITAARLLGDAADSPIVADKNQNSYALFVTYRF